ncbi:ExeM/NucH family extracellular endonuclease [Micrococcus luteus]
MSMKHTSRFTAAFAAGVLCVGTVVTTAPVAGATDAPAPATVSAPVINEFVTDTVGADLHEYVEVLVPAGVDPSTLSVISVEGDNNTRQGNVLSVDRLTSVDADGRALVERNFQNGSVSFLLVSGAVATGQSLDAIIDGLTVHDSVGVLDGDAGDRAWGTELARDVDGRGQTVGGASRVPDGGTDWVRNDFDGAGLVSDGQPVIGTPEEGEALNTPGAANALAEDGGSDPVDPVDPTLTCDMDATGIHEVQGSGASSPITGQDVVVRGVVTGVFQTGGFNGYYLQQTDATADADPATSEGVFVYAPSSAPVEQGELLTVRGTVGEHYGMTQVSQDAVTDCGTEELPAPVEVTFPITDLEPTEGMRVTVSEAVVLETYQYARYGTIVVGPERQYTPTAVHAPESPEAQTLYEQNLANRITVDDGRSVQNPDPALHPGGGAFTLENLFSGGDTLTDLTGVLDYRYDTWALQPTQDAGYEDTVTRPEVPEVGGDLQVASFNVLNYFTTLNERGATTAEEFERQKAKIVSAILEMDADVVGLLEIENNGDVALNDLVAALNAAAGEERYAALETGRIGTDQITTAMIYQPASVSPVGAHKVLDSSVDARFDDTKNRPALAQTFAPVVPEGSTAELDEFTVVTNHLKSKGSECAGDPTDLNHLTGNCDQVRTDAAEALVDWAGSDELPNAVIMGDLNAYDHERPIRTLVEGGFTDLEKAFGGEYAYSYVFDGMLGYLDYALADADLAPRVTGASSWHINADEVPLIGYETRYKKPAQQDVYAPDAYRSSDHDPVLFGLDLGISSVTPDPDPDPETCEITDFADNPEGSQFYSAVRWMQCAEITSGYVDGTYKKHRDITRGESIAFLYRYLKPEHTASTTSPFSDVSTGFTHYEAITWAAQAGVTTGYLDGTFRPKKDVTRGEFASFMYRAAGEPEFTAPSESPYSDVLPGQAHYTAITWLHEQGIVEGYGDGTYRAGTDISRGEVAVIMERFDSTR